MLQLGNGLTEIASVYDIATQTFTPFHFSTNAFCAGHVAAPDGSVVIAGESSCWGLLLGLESLSQLLPSLFFSDAFCDACLIVAA